MSVALGSSAHAQTRMFVDHSVTASGSGTSWNQALKTVQEALAEMASTSSVVEIWVRGDPSSTPFLHKPGTTQSDTFLIESGATAVSGILVAGRFTGTETSLTQRNLAQNPTILSGKVGTSPDVYCQHVVTVADSVSVVVELNGLRIEDGRAVDPFSIDGDGGGVWVQWTSGNPGPERRVVHCDFMANEAGFDGGAISCFEPLWIRHSVFESNTAGGASGAVSGWDVRAAHSRFRENESIANGGAMYVRSVEAANCAFIANQSSGSGGAIFSKSEFSGALSRLANCTFAYNEAFGQGGAIAVAHALELHSCTIAFNTGSYSSGVYAFGGGGTPGPKARNSILWGNDYDGNEGDPGVDQQIYSDISGSPVDLQYSCVQGLASPTTNGNINLDPEFRSSSLSTLDLRLDPDTSPAWDAGDESKRPEDWLDINDNNDFEELLPWDADRRRRWIGDEVDMGAFEGCPGDVNGDGTVNGADLALILGNTWGSCQPPCAPSVSGNAFSLDLNGDYQLGGADLAVVLGNWLCGSSSMEFTESSSNPLEVMELLGFESFEAFAAWLDGLERDAAAWLFWEYLP